MLPQSFYSSSALDVARNLLGARLIRRTHQQTQVGMIFETEAYMGESDLACHAHSGRTPRTATMYGPPGRAYIYFIYGMHWMLNVVTEPEGTPAAVLIRAILPLDPLAERLIDGPARTCKWMQITGALNGIDLTDPQGELSIAAGETVPEEAIWRGPRVGINSVPEPWRSQPWRLRIDEKQWNPVRSSHE